MQRGTANTRRRLTAALAGPVALALCCGGATPALAAVRTDSQASAHARTKVVKDPLAGVRAKALSDISIDGRRLAVVLHAGSASTLLSSDEQGDLANAGIYQGIAVRDDRVAVMRAKTRKAIAAAVASAQRTVAVGTLELAVSVEAETDLTAGASISTAVSTLTAEATTAAANGDDTTDLTSDLDAVSTDLESAQGDESTAVTDVLTLSPTAVLADLKAAVALAQDDLAAIDQDISDATADLATAQSDYAALTSGDGTDPGDGSGDGS